LAHVNVFQGFHFLFNLWRTDPVTIKFRNTHQFREVLAKLSNQAGTLGIQRRGEGGRGYPLHFLRVLDLKLALPFLYHFTSAI